jgi:GT2 family glycosyltransferase
LEGTNWAMRTDLIKQVGGFDLAFDGVAEWYDDDVVFKVKKLGYKLEYNPHAFLYHMPQRGSHYSERVKDFGRIKNWLRFHKRHSRFHPKMIIWFFLMLGYVIWKR